MTASGNPIEIRLSKKKILLILLISIVFTAIGFWFVTNPPIIKNPVFGNPLMITVLGYASIVFSVICIIFCIRKLPDNKPGLIVDNEGFIDNSSGVSGGQILWKDIENISIFEMGRQKLIMLQVNNPEEYINRQTNGFKRKLMAMNHKMYGTPLSITANTLDISFEELLAILSEKLNNSKQ